MAKNTKTGGRKKGTPNRERKTLIEMLEEKYSGYNPVMAMAEIANNKKINIILRFQANKEVAKYVSPQLKAVQMDLKDITEPPRITAIEFFHTYLPDKNKDQIENK